MFNARNRKYILHLSSSYLQMFVGIIVTIFLVPYMTKVMGQEVYGIWILLNSLVVFFGLGTLGFGNTLVRELSKTDSSIEINKFVSTMIVLYFMVAFFTSIVFFVVWLNMGDFFVISTAFLDDARQAFLIVYIMFLINIFGSVFNGLLFAKGKLQVQALIATLQLLLSGILIYQVLYAGYSLVAVTTVHLILTVVSTFITYLFSRSYVTLQITFQNFDFGLLKEMFRPSLHYFIVSIAAMIVMYSDNLVISSFLGVASVTAYALGYKIIDLSQKILYKIVDILIPDIAKMYGLGEYKNILLMHNKVLKYSILLSLVGYGILFFVGTNILQLWVGQEFTISLDIFRIFVMYGFLHSFTHVSSTFIVAMGIHKETSYMGMLTALLNLILSIGLLPYYGLPGVALGTLIAHILTIGWFANFWFYKNIYLKLQKVN